VDKSGHDSKFTEWKEKNKIYEREREKLENVEKSVEKSLGCPRKGLRKYNQKAIYGRRYNNRAAVCWEFNVQPAFSNGINVQPHRACCLSVSNVNALT
jgi:hypothetical protein